ncbi:TetR/AcrR family transcriptional regulator [Cupriavidus pauculus]|uniref:TetR/AcrR family transcriptional regulator n=1 Tax=Cupriavidus pauculus TaxID=82633 RepID=A0A2N5CDK7_9BURK|nr:TetR/AcrR family transcriptional regulator [Cupriavidus pauculus]PLQ00299.1 TetR/AcrR family transcriptional regulator [Cupriavidus pauculus]
MTTKINPGFQRARTDQQREVRRAIILDTARELLDTLSVREISLRELSRKVDLSKANVIRYFETREAVFFTLLNRTLEDWLADLPAELTADLPDDRVELASLARALARSIANRPIICKLWSALGGELESNLSTEAVRAFKLEHAERQSQLAKILREFVPQISSESARDFASMFVVLVAGLWPFANPSASVQQALLDPALAAARVDFVARLSHFLSISLAGIAASDAQPDTKWR